MDSERLLVIDNIARALQDGDTYRKVELFDPIITDEDRRRVIYPFDCLRKRPKNKLKAFCARIIAEHLTQKINVNTDIVGLENAAGITGGAIITCNHFNIIDNTIPRLLAKKCGKGKKFSIIVQETNVFMKGFFGFLMRNCNTLPVSSSVQYMAKNFKPALRELLEGGSFVLIYPEAEMWFNYKKPRPMREGAYHLAYDFGVPIIPCFVEMREIEGTDAAGFKNVKHTLHVMPPIYPDKQLPLREGRARMQEIDTKYKRECYERVYGVSPDSEFVPERDIAGYNNK